MKHKARKIVLVIAAAITGTALLPSAASAWTNPGNYTFTNTGGGMVNPLVSTIESMGRPTITTANVQYPTELGNGVFAVAPWSAEQDAGHVAPSQGAVVRTRTGTTTSLPNCTVVTATEDEWNLTDSKLTTNARVQLADVHITFTFAGPSCALNGEMLEVFGSVEAQVSYPTTGCAAGQQRTRWTFVDVDGLWVTEVTPVQAIGRGTTFRETSGFIETPCVGSALNPEMTPG